MNRKIKGLTMLAVMLGIFVTLMASSTAYAADAKILETNVYEGNIYIFVKGISELPPEPAIQIGNTVCRTEQISSASFAQMNPFMKTLILVDNSISIPEENRVDFQKILKGIISNSNENELIKICTFSKETECLCDYTSDHSALESAVDGMDYNDQDSYLSDVLYNAVSELKTEDTYECRRIIILSDGADDNYIGYSNDEVCRYIESSQYPVYTVGIPRKNNAQQLETLFSFSRAAKTDYFYMDGSIASGDIVNAIMTDQTGICIKLTPDEALKDGSNKSLLLKLDGAEGDVELKTSVDMPFGNGSAVLPEPESETEEETADSLPSIGPESINMSVNDENIEKDGEIPIYVWILIALMLFIIIALIAMVVILLLLMRKNKGDIPDTPLTRKIPQPIKNTVLTVMNKNTRSQEKKHLGDYVGDSEKKFWHKKRIVLRNLDNPNKIYEAPIRDVVKIGRSSSQDICIYDDNEVSSRHCEILLRGGLMYLKRIECRNGTYYEGINLSTDEERPIISGGKIKMGKYQYSVELIDSDDGR